MTAEEILRLPLNEARKAAMREFVGQTMSKPTFDYVIKELKIKEENGDLSIGASNQGSAKGPKQ